MAADLTLRLDHTGGSATLTLMDSQHSAVAAQAFSAITDTVDIVGSDCADRRKPCDHNVSIMCLLYDHFLEP
jgi:hypothetical protein